MTGPDAPEPFDRKRMEERELAVGRDDEEPVGLGNPARDLGEELRPRHTDRDRQADLLSHLLPQAHGDLGRRSHAPLHPADVEERLVDREPLDDRSRVLEHPKYGLARFGVGRHPRRHDGRLRAEAAGRRRAHRGADAVRLRLVAGRQHDPQPHDHRAAAQAWVVALLDGREERVEVCVQDRGIPRRHEHMFSHDQ